MLEWKGNVAITVNPAIASHAGRRESRHKGLFGVDWPAVTPAMQLQLFFLKREACSCTAADDQP
jgi:hypothetical protein